MKSIISIIKERRRSLNIDQGTLAQKAGLSQSQISQVESGNKSLSLDAIHRVCEALNLEIKIVKKEQQ